MLRLGLRKTHHLGGEVDPEDLISRTGEGKGLDPGVAAYIEEPALRWRHGPYDFDGHALGPRTHRIHANRCVVLSRDLIVRRLDVFVVSVQGVAFHHVGSIRFCAQMIGKLASSIPSRMPFARRLKRKPRPGSKRWFRGGPIVAASAASNRLRTK